MKKNELEEFKELNLKESIFTIRGFQVMVDRDLSKLYKVETKALNQAVKRNLIRFPEHYYFQLTTVEKNELVTNCDRLSNLKHSNNPPYVFTEHGVAMLSSVLRSNTAAEISIKIVNTFVQIRKFINSNAQIFQRLDRVELKQIETDSRIDKVFSALENKDNIPKQGIFFDGQIFDAYNFVSNLFKSAKKSVTIIDNYIDNSVLIHLTEVEKNIKVKILTRSISPKLQQHIKKFEDQYFPLTLKIVKNYHDRFIIIDEKEVYHIGASLKDLGKKIFAFSKMEKTALNNNF
ncbi:MAG: ORF6N domain-containing protein [Candidatus Delongbacteria bacterium]|jgi:hypothetical protein|nr:ORF6N domain-containing protein [Candidatus Delongbacteria bacterium]